MCIRDSSWAVRTPDIDRAAGRPSPQLRREEAGGKLRGRTMDRGTVDAGRVDAERRQGLAPRGGALVQERIVADAARKDRQRGVRDLGGDTLCAGVDRHDRVAGARDDRDRDGDRRKALGREDRAKRGRHREHRADARLAVGPPVLVQRGCVGGIGARPRLALLQQVGHLGRRLAGRLVLAARCAERRKPCTRGDAAGKRDHGVAAEREAGGPNARAIDTRTERRIGQHGVEHHADVLRALPPQHEALHGVGPVSYTHLDVYKRQVFEGIADQHGRDGKQSE